MNVENKLNEIKLVQPPIIKHKLEEIGKSVDNRLMELNLENQVATIDTIKTLKALRTTLNKENKIWGDQLKVVIEPAISPINELKSIFKENITVKYKNADSILKDEISSYEMLVKKNKEENIKLYFTELCQSYNIDFLKFENVGLEINLSTTEKKYKKLCNVFVEKIVDDIELINLQEHKVEIMVEFKKDLNASKAIKDVQVRKQLEEEEQEREDQKTLNNRIKKLESIGMSYDDMTKTYSFNDKIYLSRDGLLAIKDFPLKVVEIEEKIKAIQKNERLVKAGIARSEMLAEIGIKLSALDCQGMPEDVWSEFYSEKNKEFQGVKNKEFIADLKEKKDLSKSEENEAKQIYRQNKMVELGLKFDGQSFTYKDINFHFTDLLGMSSPEFAKAFEGAKNRMEQLKIEENSIKREPLKAPVIEEKPKEFTAKFEVTATMIQLKALKYYLQENNLTFKTI